MLFDWHGPKNERNIAQRQLSFGRAALIFGGRTVEKVDDRRDYGEVRVIAIGNVQGQSLTVVYTDREDVRWIISARPSSREERALWHEL